MLRSGTWTSYKEKLRQLSDRLVEAQRPIRIRDAVKWDEQIEAEGLSSRFTRLPEIGPEYYQRKRPLPYAPQTKIDECEAIKCDLEQSIGAQDALGAILHRNCCQYQ